jgi:hypothetical protein
MLHETISRSTTGWRLNGRGESQTDSVPLSIASRNDARSRPFIGTPSSSSLDRSAGWQRGRRLDEHARVEMFTQLPAARKARPCSTQVIVTAAGSGTAHARADRTWSISFQGWIRPTGFRTCLSICVKNLLNVSPRLCDPKRLATRSVWTATATPVAPVLRRPQDECRSIRAKLSFWRVSLRGLREADDVRKR